MRIFQTLDSIIELHHVLRDLNSGPEEQSVLLTLEPTLQPETLPVLITLFWGYSPRLFWGYISPKIALIPKYPYSG